jgi:hypothetical protein
MKSIVLLILISFFNLSNLLAQIKNKEELTFSEIKDGLAVVTDKETGKRGLVNTNHDFVTDIEFDIITFLGNGYYSVTKVKNSGEKSGVVGDQGRLYLKTKFNEVWVDKKPNGMPKIVMTKSYEWRKQKIWTVDNGELIRDWSI